MRHRNPGQVAAASAILGGMLASGLLILQGAQTELTTSTANTGNAIIMGSVDISDDDSGTALLDTAGLAPGHTEQRCITVTYTGTLPSTVTLTAAYLAGDVTTNPLARHLIFKIETVGLSGPCAGASGTEIEASSPLLADKIAALAAPGITIGWGTAVPGEQHRYRLTYSLRDDRNAQGQSASVTFNWRSTNS